MAYVRRRWTKADNVSTTLVESYRDEAGRPRQHILANLYQEVCWMILIIFLQIISLDNNHKDHIL